MALTLNGRRTGRAGAEELRELRESLFDQLEEELEALKDRYGELMDELKLLDPEGWEDWYDDEANVPDFKGWMNCEPAMTALRRRVAELKGLHEPIVALSSGSVTSSEA